MQLRWLRRHLGGKEGDEEALAYIRRQVIETVLERE